MNKTLANVIIFTAGAALGSLATFLACKDYFALKADLEVDSVKKAYADMVNSMGDSVSSLDNGLEGPEEVESDYESYMQPTVSSISKKLNNKPPMVEYSKFFKKAENKEKEDELAEREHPRDDDEELDENDIADDELNGAHRDAIISDKKPYVIEPEDYNLNCKHYDKVNLVYNINSNILLDEDGDEIKPDIYIGDCLVMSSFNDDEDEYLYVRNDKLTTDYMIEKVFN